jgi:hypothetical protein
MIAIDDEYPCRIGLFMQLLDAITIAAVAAALALCAAVAFIVASLTRAAPLLAARLGRSRIDVVLVRNGRRTWRPQQTRQPLLASHVAGPQPALRSVTH